MFKDNLTTILAVWGAIVSTVALTWNIVRSIQDNGKLRVYAWIGKQAAVDTDKWFLMCSVTNIGRRPIQVNQWGIMMNKEEYIILPRGLPKLLSEGESHVEYANDLSKINMDLRTIFAVDSTGKRWKITRKNRNALLINKQNFLIK